MSGSVEISGSENSGVPHFVVDHLDAVDCDLPFAVGFSSVTVARTDGDLLVMVLHDANGRPCGLLKLGKAAALDVSEDLRELANGLPG